MPNSYLSWIKANEALTKCMSAQKADEWKAMSAADQGSVCKAETAAVSEMLTSDKVSFRNLLSERMAAMKQ